MKTLTYEEAVEIGGNVRKWKLPAIGELFGKWLVVGYCLGKQCRGHRVDLVCECECGTKQAIPPHNLFRGLSTRCERCMHADREKTQVGDTSGSRWVLKCESPNRVLVECSCGRRDWVSARSFRVSAACPSCANRGNVGHGKVLVKVDGRSLKLPDCMELLGVSRQRVFQLRDKGLLESRLRAAMEARP